MYYLNSVKSYFFRLRIGLLVRPQNIKWLIYVLVILFNFWTSIDTYYLMDENQDINNESLNPNTSENSEIEKSEEQKADEERAAKRKLEFELKMQRLMSGHMESTLSELQNKIQTNTNPTDEPKEELEDAYYNEVDYKIEVDTLTSKLNTDLTLQESTSSNEASASNNKRSIADLTQSESENKKRKEEE
jgi:hypothetical protein